MTSGGFMNESAEGQVVENSGSAKIIYILYLVGIVIPLVSIIGVIMAYVNKGDAPDWLQTHYRYQIRTFWIGFLYVFIGAVTSVIIVGYLILLFCLIWFIVRCVKGMGSLDQNQPVPNPTSWMFG
jgi:uncharacterized membrane protein